MLTVDELHDAFCIDVGPIEDYLRELFKAYGVRQLACCPCEIAMEELIYKFYGMGARMFSNPMLDSLMEDQHTPPDVRTALVSELRDFIERKITDFVSQEHREQYTFTDEWIGGTLIRFQGPQVNFKNGEPPC